MARTHPNSRRFRLWSAHVLVLLTFVLADRSPVLVLGLAASETEKATQTETVSALRISPGGVVLRGDGARQRFLLSGERDGRRVDLTREAAFHTTTPGTIRVTPDGAVAPVSDGIGVVEARIGSSRICAEVRVVGAGKTLPLYFETHIQPILTRQGCNSGACHGKQRGQNGFQLSLLGFDDDFDYSAVTKGLYSRRLSQAFPERSLFLLKPTGELPHGGGQRFAPASADYRTLRDWIERGLLRRPDGAPVVERVTVTPGARRMANHETQQLLVMAHSSDGSARDVTDLATYMSSESPVVKVDEHGLATSGSVPGQATIMVRFRTLVATCRMTVPLEGKVEKAFYATLPRHNFIDEHAWKNLESLGFTPSAPAGDATFLRRAYLDVIGRLPSPAEAREFLKDTSEDRRARLVDHLLVRPEYADHWAGKWVDLLRPNPYRVGMKAVLNLDAWVRASFRRNQPYDGFVRDAVTASGSTFRSGATTILRDRRTPEEIATMVSQLFLGIRLECARCHHHPFESLSQTDFYSFAAYFARIGRKGTGLSPPISGGEEFFFTKATGRVTHPRTGEALSPRPLFGEPPAKRHTDPRMELADWMTRDNPHFARVMVNRVWADLMGRGLVEPVDDLRVTNPPSNAALLDALARHFREIDYDLKKLLRTIMSSYVYALSSTPSDRNLMDTRQYSRHYRQRLRAEVLLDAVCDITGVPEPFSAVPAGSRANAIWTHRSPSLFLDTFGRPDPNQDPPCERIPDTSVVQALHLMNSPGLNGKVTSDKGRAAKLASSEMSDEAIVEELYLLVYNRYPQKAERDAALARFAASPDEKVRSDRRRRVTEDLLWALLNTAEFVFKD